MPKVTYDKETKILMIRLKKAPIKDSIIEKNCVFDYDEKGNICNIEVLDFNLEKSLEG